MKCKDIRELVENAYNMDTLAKDTRSRRYTEVRAIYYRLCETYAEDFTLTKSAEVVGRSSHATSLNGLNVFEWMINTPAWVDHKEKYDNLVNRIRQRRINGNSKRAIHNRSKTNRVIFNNENL